jgi:alpha-L-fucosidase
MSDFLALVGDGLSGTYYPNRIMTGTPVLTRIDPIVNFDWSFGFPDAPIIARPFGVKWTGWVMPQYSEGYTFYVRAGGAVTLSVNGQLVIDMSNNQPHVELGSKQQIAMMAGQMYRIEMDWHVSADTAAVQLSWSSPSTPKGVIPQWQLFSGALITSLTPIIDTYTLLYKNGAFGDNVPADHSGRVVSL